VYVLVVMNDLCATIHSACRVYNELLSTVTSITSGVGTRFFRTHAANPILIEPRLVDGTRAACVAIEDVCVTASDDSNALPICVYTQIRVDSERGNITITYTLGNVDAAPRAMRVHVHVCSVSLVDVRVAPKAFDSRTGGHLHIRRAFPDFSGYMAIHPTGSCLAVTDYSTSCVIVFSLPDMQFVRKFGRRGSGPGELYNPCGLCFIATGTLLVMDYSNARVAHWTLDGEWITSYDVPRPWCVAARGDVVVIGCSFSQGMYELSLQSGVVTSVLGENSISAVAFMDATTLAVANRSALAIELYTLEGTFKQQIDTDAIFSFGLAVCADGCLLVSDCNQKRVRVFLPTGIESDASPLASYSFENSIRTVALHDEHAYVLEKLIDVESSRIHVFV
jgi:hypothetical protein